MPKELISDFVAGWIGGGAGLLIGHPMDTVKVRLQTMNYGGIINCVVSTFKHEAVNGFYKGMFAPFMSVGLMNSLYFGGYGIGMKLLNHGVDVKDSQFEPPIIQVMLATNVGSLLQWIPGVPVEVIKIKLQIQKENVGHIWESRHYHPSKPSLYTGPVNCFRRLLSTHGVRKGLYQGGTITILRDVIGFQFYLPGYHYLNRLFKTENDQYKVLSTLFAGGLAGSVSWFSIMPLDFVKSRIQAQDPEHLKYRNWMECTKQCYKEGGVKIFYRGALVMVVRSFPVNSVVFVVYQYILDNMDKFIRET